MLIMLLDGLWAGIQANITTYEDNVGADLYVAQPGARNFFGSVSVIPADTVETVRALPDVDWAVSIRSFLSIVQLHDRKVPTAVVGFTPGDRGGPWEFGSGRGPSADDEIAVGSVIARQHGLDLGDEIQIMGRRFRIVGTTSDAFMLSFVFMTHAATDDLLRSPGTTSFVLLGTDEPGAVRERLAETGLSILDRDTLARNDLSLMARAYEVPLTVMRAVAFVIGILVIALTAYSAIVERRRDYGIVKAIGARGRHLVRIAVEQTLMVATVGLVAGAVLFVVARELISSARPQFVILATTGNVTRAVVAAVLMALLAALLPARRLARLEPATAYRGG
jgi:putative ABC transport system permease protein